MMAVMRLFVRVVVVMVFGWSGSLIGEQSDDASTANRNALRDSRVVGDAVIALSTSGELFRLDRKSLRLTHTRRIDLGAVCLGDGEGESVLVGTSNGDIYRVSAIDLTPTNIAHVAKSPVWVGRAGSESPQEGVSLAAIIDDSGGIPERQARCSIHDLTHNRSYPCTVSPLDAPMMAATFFADRNSRVWIGADQGEWGGWCGSLDLDTGKLRESTLGPRGVYNFNPQAGQLGESRQVPGGVYGFVELGSGRVWTYGGTSHMGFNSAFIARVDNGALELLFTNDWFAVEGSKQAKSRPVFPITHIVPIPSSGSLLVFSFSDVFRVDPQFKRWTRVCELPIRYNPGRPDAVGSYPAVQRVHVLDGVKLTFLCSTARDGFVLFTDGHISLHPLPTARGN